MELKQYQQRVLGDLDTFLRHLCELKDIPRAYTQTWLDNGILIGGDGMPPYRNTIPQVPHVCFKVPTGGGKTLLACAALRHIYDGISQMSASPVRNKVVVWLVPSNAILEQTLAALRNPDHPYRRQINVDFQNRVEILDGTQALNAENFTPTTVRENLSIVVMSFDALRIKRKEGRKVNQENGSLNPFVATYEHPETLIAGVPENALTQVLNQMSPVVIIDESHNAQSELSVEMIRNLCPSFVLDLTATPRQNSNIISIVDARELKRENMVKLPVIVYNRPSAQEVIENAIYLRACMEARAKEMQAAGGAYIRPIVLFQAQPKTSDDSATFTKLKGQLVESGIPEQQIAIKTADINEIKGKDLLSPDCPIRYIITVNALKEGWDCPFAYILATLANRSARVDVEQIVGRVLRLPYTRKHSEPSLNMAYILTSSKDFNATVESIVAGLNHAGFTDKSCRAIDTVDTPEVTPQPPEQQTIPVQPSNEDPKEEQPADPEGTTDNEDFTFDPSIARRKLEDQKDTPESVADPAGAVGQMLQEAENQNQQYERQTAEQEAAGTSPSGGDEMRHRYEIQASFAESASALALPVFVQDVSGGFFGDAGLIPLTREDLTNGFTLMDKDLQISFAVTTEDVMKVDVESDSRPRVVSLQEREALQFRKLIQDARPDEKRNLIVQNIFNSLNRINYVSDGDLRSYIQRVVHAMSPDDLAKAETAMPFFVSQVKKKIESLAEEYREKRFFTLIETGDIKVEATWHFPRIISPVPTMIPLAKALYTDEGQVNGFEMRVIRGISSMDNVVWWHRNVERHGFCLNGFINHYPDFIIYTQKGNIILLETKGDDRDNSDSRKKLRLGRKWANMAGSQYRYYMVFDENDTGFDGAYRFTDFCGIMPGL